MRIISLICYKNVDLPFKGSRLRSGELRRGMQGSTPPLAKKTASQIEKETLEKRISNNECRMSKECILPVVSFCVERSIL